MRRAVSVFGSTGSVGANTVELLERQGGADAYQVEVLSAFGNADALARQARALQARRAVIVDETQRERLQKLLAGTDTQVMAGKSALVEAAKIPVDWAMSAIVGAAGLPPTIALARQGGTLALANKESLVCAGAYLMALCAEFGTTLIPVDSEHSAIFQCLGAAPDREVERIILTASGGPFRTWDAARIATAKLEDALKHPNWSMGQRITIDSASMFNKALEVIEAHHLFGTAPARIEVVVHPQSIVHSMVGFADGAVIAQMGPPDMRGPIGYALNHPQRHDLPVERLDFTQTANLTFEPPDMAKFPALGLAYEALATGGAAGAVLNAAKETALDAFLEQRIGFGDMAQLVSKTLHDLGEGASGVVASDGLDPISEFDKRARDHVVAQIGREKAPLNNLAG